MAVRVATSVTVPRPPQEVFDFLMDAANNCRWQRGVEHAVQDGPARVGTRITEVRRLCGQPVRTVFAIVEHDPPRLAVVRSEAGPVVFCASYTVTPHPLGSTVMLRGQIDHVSLPWAGGRLAQRRLDEELRTNAANLARALSQAAPELSVG